MGKLLLECENKNFNCKKIAKAVYKTLHQKELLKAEVVCVSAEEIQELNKSTRKIDKVTDVLSYPTLNNIKNTILKNNEYSADCEGKFLCIGSIVICEDKINEQAVEYGHSLERERTYLIVHGLMHLFGYDHLNETDKKEMRENEKKALMLLGINE